MPREYFTVYIDSEVKKQFYDLVKSKYESLKGPLSAETEDALRAWLRTHKQAQLVPIKVNPALPHTHVYMDQIIGVLRNDFGLLRQASLDDLKKAVAQVRGSDQRTVEKWIKILLQEKKVKRLHMYLYEIV